MSDSAALYARVSTDNQDLKRQEEKLEDWAEENGYNYTLFSEKVSSVKERPKFEQIMSNLEDYDVVAVTKLDRFGRSTRDILGKIEQVEQNGAEFITTEQPIDTGDEIIGDILVKLLSVFADFERQMIRQRMEEGYREAVEEGRTGRPSALTEQQQAEAYDRYQDGLSVSKVKVYLNGKYPDFDGSDSAVYRAIQREKEVRDEE